jgi:hypothetical protein
VEKRSFTCPDCGLVYETYSPNVRFKKCGGTAILDSRLTLTETLNRHKELKVPPCHSKNAAILDSRLTLTFLESMLIALRETGSVQVTLGRHGRVPSLAELVLEASAK